MIGGGLARRYVQSLFELAQEKDLLEKVTADIQDLDQLIKDSEGRTASFLFDPSVGCDAKRGTMKELFGDASEYTLNFLNVVIDKNRTSILCEVREIFDDMLNALNGVNTGTICSAVALEDELFDEIKNLLEDQFSCKLIMDREVDPALLGGLRIQVGNTVIDSSVNGRLDRLKDVLIRA